MFGPLEYSAIRITRGSCVRLSVVYQSSEWVPEDVVADQFSIEQASRQELVGAPISFTENMGEIEIYFDEEATATLPLGAREWFVVKRVQDDGCVVNTPRIYLEVLS